MLELLIGPIYKILDKVVPDLDERARMANQIALMASDQAREVAQAQAAINASEAQHRSWFVSCWRPAMGWVCVFGFTLNYLVVPFTGIDPLDMTGMVPILMGMLGLGGLRTVEKNLGLTK